MTDGFDNIRECLSLYDGEPIKIMEICGSHTAAITKSGIRSILSPKIHLVSGPGCPVCVTPSAYIDRLIDLALEEQVCIVTFGDMLRVPGSQMSLSQAKGEGADVRMVYSPFDTIKLAETRPDKKFVFAAVGFETTTPIYAEMVEELIQKKITNVKLLTALKTMPSIVDCLCREQADIDGFLAPGHVCSVTGSSIFEPLAEKYSIPFVAAGFSGKELLAAIYATVRMKGKGQVLNYYPRVVTKEGNVAAQKKVETFFVVCDAVWRGMGMVPASGMRLKDEYMDYDAGSMELVEDIRLNKRCMCGQVLMGRIKPENCSLFGKECTPLSPQGACMVSEEGSCRYAYSECRR
ncbi:MAG: hydrogenase formation protein HypD [Lachnospiraceae bacterium]